MFEYNKKTTILTAEGNVASIDNLNNIVTKSNKIIYQKNLEKYFSQGKTNITIEDKYIINSKNVSLLRCTFIYIQIINFRLLYIF